MITIAPPPATPATLQTAIAAAYARAKAARHDPYDRPNYRQQKEREHLAEAARLRRELTLLESSLAAAPANTALNHQTDSLHHHHHNQANAPVAAAA